jgi:GT2 family glycosyltransferase
MTPQPPLVSIVMLSFNRKAEVLKGLNEIRKIGYPQLEVIVVDNASQDETARMVSTRFPDVNLISLKENIGVAAANYGFRAAQGKYVIIIDDDSYPLPDAVGRMVELFEKDEKIGIVAFHVRNVSHYHHPENQPPSPIPAPPTGYRMGFNGAGAGFRKDLLIKCGGYSEHFFLYWNELDLALRVLNEGFTIVGDEQIVALHQYSPTNRSSLRAPFFYTRNLLWLYWQYWPLPLMIKRVTGLLNACLYHSLEQRNTIYIRAFFSGLMGLGALRRTPIADSMIKSLRLTEKLAFIYFR